MYSVSFYLPATDELLRGSGVHWKEHQSPGAGSTAGDISSSHIASQNLWVGQEDQLAQLTSGPLSRMTRRISPCVPELSASCFPSQSSPAPTWPPLFFCTPAGTSFTFCFFCKSHHLIFAKLHPSIAWLLHQAPPLKSPMPASSFPLNTALNTSSFCS